MFGKLKKLASAAVKDPTEEEIRHFGRNNLPYPFSVQKIDNVGEMEDLYILRAGGTDIASESFIHDSQGATWYPTIARILNEALMNENDSANLAEYVRNVREELHYIKKWLENDKSYRSVYDQERNSDGFKISFNRLLELIEKRRTTPLSKDQEIARIQEERDALQREVTMYRQLFKKFNELGDHIELKFNNYIEEKTKNRMSKELKLAICMIRNMYVKMGSYNLTEEEQLEKGNRY